MPISTRRLKAVECELLVEKMVLRIRLWSTKNLSFTGRAQLINVVLMSIHNYLAQIFILPEAVLNSVNEVCRNFSWCGNVIGGNTGYIKWSVVVLKINKGALVLEIFRYGIKQLWGNCCGTLAAGNMKFGLNGCIPFILGETIVGLQGTT